MLCQKITLVGVGLLGGSLGLAIRQRGLAGRVDGYVRRAASVEECTRVGAVDQATLDLERAVRDADLVVLCTPIGQMPEIARRMLPALKAGAVVTDVGSVKGVVVRELEPLVASAGAAFVGSHPMAGAEKTGVEHARAGLYQGAVCVVTPTEQTVPAAQRQVEALWQAVGARILCMPAAQHDALVSRSSHLVQLIATQLVNHVLAPGAPREQGLLCAGGFRDTTRIASGSPEMWRDIAMANRDQVLLTLGEFIGGLQELHAVLSVQDGAALMERFVRAKQIRDAWLAPTANGGPD